MERGNSPTATPVGRFRWRGAMARENRAGSFARADPAAVALSVGGCYRARRPGGLSRSLVALSWWAGRSLAAPEWPLTRVCFSRFAYHATGHWRVMACLPPAPHAVYASHALCLPWRQAHARRCWQRRRLAAVRVAAPPRPPMCHSPARDAVAPSPRALACAAQLR